MFFYPPLGTNRPEVGTIFVRLTIGAAGAATVDTTESVGILSIDNTNAATGKYVLKLTDPYQKLVGHSLGILCPSTVNSGVSACTGGNVVTDNSNGSTPSITFQMVAAGSGAVAPAAAAPANGEELRLTFQLRNSQAG